MASVSEVRTDAKVNDAILPGALPLSALVVDDDHCLLQVVHQMMEVFGFRTDSANGGHAAMLSLFQSRYDVVITDLQMPDMDGYALSGWVKSKFKNTKVIVMTGSNGSDLADFRHTGIVDCWLSKPFSLTVLAGILDELVPTASLKRFAHHAGRHRSACYDGQPSIR